MRNFFDLIKIPRLYSNNVCFEVNIQFAVEYMRFIISAWCRVYELEMWLNRNIIENHVVFMVRFLDFPCEIRVVEIYNSLFFRSRFLIGIDKQICRI